MGAAREMIAWLGRGVARVGSGMQNMAVVSRSTSGLLGAEDMLINGVGLAGGAISPRLGIQLSYVYQSVKVLNQSVASLPGILYRRLDDGGKVRAIDDPLFDILRYKPTDSYNLNSYTLYELIMTHLLLWGNAYCWLNRLSDGTIRDIIPLMPWNVSIRRDKPRGPLTYVVWGEGGGQTEFPEKNILHVRGMTFDGVIGRSPMSVVGNVTRDYGSTAFEQGPNSGMAIALEGALGEKAAKRLTDDLKEMGAPENWHRPMLLEGGAKWIKMPFNLADAQLLETRKFQKNEIAGIYRVPPHMIAAMDDATFSNIENQSLDFYKLSLKPNLDSIEMAIMTQIFDADGRRAFAFEFLVDSLLKGDIKTRYNAYKDGILTGFMSRNLSRKSEGWNPIDGLDAPLVPLNVSTVDADGNRTEITIAMAELDENGDIKMVGNRPLLITEAQLYEQLQENYREVA